MVRCFLILSIVAGCSAIDKPDSVSQTIPAELKSCPPAAKAPAPPPVPRTVEALAAGYNRVQVAREQTKAARDECADKLQQVIELIER